MTCLIIEDEKVAAERLKNLVYSCNSDIEVLAIIQSIEKAVEWFNENISPDLVFMDIHLADGLSFEIFEQTLVEAPVIFTTAYDEYALKAFKVNSIDYLLKPIDKEGLGQAIKVFQNGPYAKSKTSYPKELFDKVLKTLSNEYKNKFVVKVGEHIKVIPVDNIVCFFSMEKASFLQNKSGRDYAINHSLDELEELLDPTKFFRISRKYLIAQEAIKDIIVYSTTRLKIELTTNSVDDAIVSRERVSDFKKWLEE